jgi:hypothetical protein
MARQKPPFATTKKGIVINLGTDERGLLRRLLGEVGELLTSAPIGDPKLARLFPPAYFNNDEAETEYQRLMRDELVASRLNSIATVDEFLADDTQKTVTFAQLDAFCAALNGVRLILGTLLDVGDIDDYLDPDDPRHDELALYNFLSWLLDSAIAAISQNIGAS